MSQSDDNSNPIGPVEPYAPINPLRDKSGGQARNQPGAQHRQPKPSTSPNSTDKTPEPTPPTSHGGSRGGQIDELA